MISVVMSTHERAKDYLPKAIKSVIEQSYTDWELVIIDDCSSDNTEEVVKSFNDKRITYARLKSNYGNDTKPKNRGVRLSKGEYIAFIDDDVQYRKDHLKLLHNYITKNNVDVVYGDRMVIDSQNRFPPQIGICSDFNPQILMKRNYIDTSDVLLKREAIFDVGGWDQRYRKYVDWNLWVRMAKAGKTFLHVPYVITDYYVHDEMKSAKVMTKGDDMAKQQFVPEWNAFEVEVDLPYLHAVKEPTVAVFSLSKDRKYYTETCFTALREKNKYPFYHVVVDNGSKDGALEWLEKVYKPDFLIKNKENMGISVGQNQAVNHLLKEVNPDIIIAMDNDCLMISDDIIKIVVDLFKKNKMLCLSPYPEGLKDSPGGSPRIRYGQLGDQFMGIVNHIGGFFKATTNIPFKRGFRWSENVPKHAFQDIEFSQYLVKHGYTLGYLENLKIEHFSGTAQQHIDYPEYFRERENEKKEVYKAKHLESTNKQ